VTTQLIYDGSFEGLLTSIFEVYERKLLQVKIGREKFYLPDFHNAFLKIETDITKAERVWNGLVKKISTHKCTEVYKTFLSEQKDVEDILLSFTRHAFSSCLNIEGDYGHPAVLAVAQIAKKVHREKHRMEAFVRFQRTKDDLYFSFIEPDFNVLPLIASHFKDRYADQHWIIYDKRRNYGIHYNNESGKILEVQAEAPLSHKPLLPSSICHDEEEVYQTLWKDYFQSVNIVSRKNVKLHLRHVPTRYWKYLVEKQ